MNSTRFPFGARAPWLAALTALVALAAALPAAGAQGSQGAHGASQAGDLGLGEQQSADVGREAMWPAPTSEDWSKPCSIGWQRTFDDALAVALEEQRALLVCINMDGEIASEHYAGVRYREAEIAALYAPYVCVIASVYRHTPRDFDEQGRRIECPRFGTVTCGEHIAIEPILYERFLDGRRIAPRHIMVELDGSETYDVFYAFDTASVFQTVHDGNARRTIVARTLRRGDRTLEERVASRAVEDREAVEEAYLEGDKETRQRLVRSAIEHAQQAPTGVLRLALYDLDVELNRLARAGLARTDDPAAVELIADALCVPLEDDERAALLAQLERLGESSPRARTLTVVHKGLAARSAAVDVAGWPRAWVGSEYPAPTEHGLLLERVEKVADATSARPQDAQARLELAEASLALAVDPETTRVLAADPRTASGYGRLFFEDAKRNALAAEALGADGWRVNAAVALASWYLGERDEAFARAEAAMSDLGPDEADGWNAIATLALFAEARRNRIYDALRAKQDWPPEWLTDVDAAYSVLARHPLGSEAHVVAHYDFLRFLGAKERARDVLERGLERFPSAWLLHDRLRARILAEKGVLGLEEVYQERLARLDASPELDWFAGYAAIVAAEFQRRQGEDQRAGDSYARAIAHYERAIAARPQARETADHYVALALAGRARIALEAQELERALELVLESFARRREAAASLDGLNLSPVDTAKMLKARLQRDERADLVRRLDAALASLDPVMLELPAYERETPARATGTRRERRPGR